MPTPQWRSKMWAHQQVQSKVLSEVAGGISALVEVAKNRNQWLEGQAHLQERRHKETMKMMKWLAIGMVAIVVLCAFMLGVWVLGGFS